MPRIRTTDDEFNFGDSPPEVKSDLYEIDTTQLTYINWMGKIVGESKWGTWVVDRDSFVDKPVGWQEHEWRFGANPSNPLVPVYYSYRFRMCPIATRRRFVVEGDDGRTYYYPWFTKREDKVDGKATGQIQVLVMMPDDEIVRCLALRGFTKNVCWDNDPNNKRGVKDFPLGVAQVLTQYADRATKTLRERQNYTGDPLPILCAWWVDLIPLIEEDEHGEKRASIVDVGHGTYMNPFVADMTVGMTNSGPTGHPPLSTRYVGNETFEIFQTIRKEIGIDWEHEWADASVQEPSDEYEDTDEDEFTENIADEIPF